MKAVVVVFPGSNCDRDTYHVLQDVYGFETRYVWHKDRLSGDPDAVILPGGFSYGDRLRAGVIAAHSPVIDDIRGAAGSGVPVLGVCNGFQILVEAGLLPGALLHNESLNFMCRWTGIIVENASTPFTSKLRQGQEIPIPVANGQGRYHIDDEHLAEMERNSQIVFRYKERVNGSAGQIAGVCNREGNVVGMMPHPERAAESAINPDNGPASLIFESLLAHGGVAA